MVDVTPMIPVGRQVIEAYGAGEIRVSGVAWRTPVLVFPDRSEAWPVEGFPALVVSDFDRVLAVQPAVELLLLGCGDRMQRLPADLRMALRLSGLKVEAMETGAACRTYNVLMAEARRVAAALLPV